jgi:regulatory protein
VRRPLSLKGRALALLAQREQSRVELRRKLLRHLAKQAAGGPEPDAEPAGADPAGAEAEVDAVLASLAEAGYLSEERFVESRIHARAGRFGTRRIQAELAQHGLALPADAAATLRAGELARAAEVRAKRFDAPPADAAERARQSRFLVARGFAPETVRRLMKGLAGPE